MSKNNKFLIISIVLGVMFFNISSSAMESSNHEKKQENSNEINILKGQDNKKKEDVSSLKNEIKENVNESKIIKCEKEENGNKKSIDIKDNEIIKYWIEKWENNLICLDEQSELTNITNIDDVKNYIENSIKNNIKNFEKILDRFERYKCEFEECYNESDSYYYYEYYNNDCFFDSSKLKNVIKNENEALIEENKMQINEELVITYLNKVLKNNRSSRDKTKTYKDLIRDAYKYCFNSSDFNYTQYDKERNIFKEQELIKKLNREYEEMKCVIGIVEVLERIKQEDDENILYAIKYRLNYDCIESNRLKYVKNILEEFKKLENKFSSVEEIYNEDMCCYFNIFLRELEQAAYEGISKEFINGILDLITKCCPKRFIKEFKIYLDIKYEIICSANDIRRLVDLEEYHLLKEKKDEFFKLLGYLLNDDIFKKIEGLLSKEIEKSSRCVNYTGINFENMMYIRTIKDLLRKYNFTFPNKLEELIENDFEGAKKIREIKLILNDLAKKDLSEDELIEKTEELIEKLRGKIDDESIEKLKCFASKKYFIEDWVKVFIRYIEGDSINFYTNLKKVIERKYEEMLSVEGIIKDIKNILTVLNDGTRKDKVESCLDTFLKNIDSCICSEIGNLAKSTIIDGIKYLFENLELLEFRKFFNKIESEIRDPSDIYMNIAVLIKRECKDMKNRIEIEELKKEIENMLLEIEEKENEDDKYKESEDFKELFKKIKEKSETLYRKQHNFGQSYIRLKFDLVKNIFTGHYRIKVVNEDKRYNNANDETEME